MKNTNYLRYICWLVCLLTMAGTAVAQETLLTGATLIAPGKKEAWKGNLLISGDTIAEFPDMIPPGFSGEIMDCSGQYIMPALIDMHVHSWGNAGPEGEVEYLGTDGTACRMLYCGVGAFLDLFSLESYILKLRDRQRAKPGEGADIFCAGPIFTCDGGHGTQFGMPTRQVNSPDEARQHMSELAVSQPDIIKFVYTEKTEEMPSMDHATMQTLIATAHSYHLKTIAHIETWTDVYAVVTAGADAITHTPTGPLPDSVLQLLKEQQTWVIPTLTVQMEMAAVIEDTSLLCAPLLAEVLAQDLLEAYQKMPPTGGDLADWLAWQQEHHSQFQTSIKRMSDAGIPLLTGTDAGNPYTIQGYSLHRELLHLHAAGLSPWQVLAAATTLPGKFLGHKRDLEIGARANLLILTASPLEDLRHTQQIEGVIHYGRLLDRKALIQHCITH